MSTTTYIIIMAVCLLLSAYFSATETAFSSANITRLKTRAEKGNSRAALACKLLERYDKLLSTILIGNNIVNIAMASLGTVLFVRSFGDMGATLSTVVVTVVVLIFGEISPKSIAKDCAEKCAMLSAPILQVLIWVLMPLNLLFSLWKKLLAKVFRLNTDSKMSQEELLMLVDEVQQEVQKAAFAIYQKRIADAMASGEFPPFKASGMAYIRFAREERELFRLLFMRDRSHETIGSQDEEIRPLLALIQKNVGIGEAEARQLHLELWVFVHGIATMLATSYLDWPDAFVSDMLTELYRDMTQRYTKKEEI